jgi:hypothetical protein
LFLYIIDPDNHLDAFLFVTVSSVQNSPLARWIATCHPHHFATNLIERYATTQDGIIRDKSADESADENELRMIKAMDQGDG